jgi:hypothetical protein
MAPLTHRAGWRIAGLHVALREGGSIRLEFSFGAFICFKTKKSGCCFIEPNHPLGGKQRFTLPAKADSN